MQQTDYDPELTTPPEPPKPSGIKAFIHSQKGIVVVGAVVLAIILGIGLFMLLRNSGTTSNESAQNTEKAALRNWLAPTQELTVAGERAISPCQVLDLSTVRRVKGNLPADTRIQTENYLDASVPSGGNKVINTSCEYSFNARRSYLSLKLQVEQFTDPTRVYDFAKSFSAPEFGGLTTGSLSLGFDADKLDERIAAYQSIASNAATKNIINELKASATIYKQFQDSFSADPDAAIERMNTKGILLPSSQDDFGFEFFYKSSIYTLNDAGNLGSSDVAFRTKEPRKRFATGAGYMTAIINNARKPALSQSPAPTYLGTTDHYGDSPILEPCHILTNGIFTAATGQVENIPVERRSVFLNLAEERQLRTNQGQLQTVYPANRCTRSYQTANGIEQVIVSLEYTGSRRALATAIQERGLSNMPAMQTKADKVYTSVDSDGTTYYFTVGDYLASVAIINTSFGSNPLDAKTSQADVAKHTQVIDALVPAIKTDKAADRR